MPCRRQSEPEDLPLMTVSVHGWLDAGRLTLQLLMVWNLFHYHQVKHRSPSFMKHSPYFRSRDFGLAGQVVLWVRK